MEPREFFPKMPDEVFDSWLAPFIKQIGWPFTEKNTDTSNSRWRYLLGIDTPLNTWREYSWRLTEFYTSSVGFTKNSKLMLVSIVGHCTTDAKTMTANLENTKERFRTCAEFIAVNNCMPCPIIVKVIGNEIEIVDGHHRIAALIYLKLSNSVKVQAWVPFLSNET